MDLRLDGKVALVTGASKRLGHGIAQALAREGARVAVASRSAERIEAAARAIPGARGFAHDTSDLAAAPEHVRSVQKGRGSPPTGWSRTSAASTPPRKPLPRTPLPAPGHDRRARGVRRVPVVGACFVHHRHDAAGRRRPEPRNLMRGSL
jgi:NAD(P)-dependent dehydrogenase (short-subunit alcohol dehydrogenase family)